MYNKVKKYMKNPVKIIAYLTDKKPFYWISDKIAIRVKYKSIFNQKIDFKNPKTFNEKLQWLKLYDRKDIYTTMVDKYEVKKYVANIIGEEYIIPTIGIYNKFDDINFDILPNQFVIKCTHDSGGLVIVKDKSNLNIKSARKIIEKSLRRNYYYYGREWPYKNVKPRIIIEKYMANEKQKELIDYKFFCFNGEPKFLYVSEGLSNHKTARISFVDMDYKKTEFYRKDYKPFDELPKKPINFEKMKELAAILAKDIPFLRVDFYEIEGKIYFGELTFYPCSGFIPFEPEEWDRKLGDMLELPKQKIEEKNEK